MPADLDTKHPMGSKAKVLLTSVFGPYAQDDEYGSRLINPMELYHNQVTRVQGAFSLRMFHRSWGLMLIQSNIDNPCTCLDFPKYDRFVEEITTQQYDIIGITSILPNLGKVQKMCQLIRQHQPKAVIVVGGHIANLPNLIERVDADFAVRGDGVQWFRRYLGQDPAQPIKHPLIWSGIGRRTLGKTLPFDPSNAAAALIPSVGCPLGCNFCSTSHMFGGKGKSVNFYQTGDELFDVMCQIEAEMKVKSFFVMDENFLLYHTRALRLLSLMQEHNKSWALYVFSSANALKKYTMDQLVGLGISWVWMGLEGKDSQYGKLDGTDTHELIRNLQANGIRVLGSSIVGLEEHTLENIDEAIDYAVSHDTEFHQFMLYTPAPGTPFWAEMHAKGVMLEPEEMSEADMHGQFRFNYRHPNIPAGKETELLLRAFQRDFDVNGPSVLRIIRSTLAGYKKYKNTPDERVRARFVWEAEGLSTTMAGALWAAREWFKKTNPVVFKKVDALLKDIKQEFGFKARISAPIIGRVILHLLKKETQRLAAGWTYEPPTFYERNYVDAASPAGLVKWVASEIQAASL